MDTDRLALAIGRVVVRAVWVDEVSAELVAHYQQRTGGDRSDTARGLSGRQLTAALKKVGADDRAREYGSLYERRNAIVHGRWYLRDGETIVSVRTPPKAQNAGIVVTAEWTPAMLAALADELDAYFESTRAELLAGTGLEQHFQPGVYPYGP